MKDLGHNYGEPAIASTVKQMFYPSIHLEGDQIIPYIDKKDVGHECLVTFKVRVKSKGERELDGQEPKREMTLDLIGIAAPERKQPKNVHEAGHMAAEEYR
jgi:hypothetical protein